MTKDR